MTAYTELDAAADARQLLFTALTGSLATLEADGAPYCSLVQLAADTDGAPLTLVSRLARHTRNLERDDRVSILVDRRGVGDDPLRQARVSATGRLRPTDAARRRARYLAHHPDAAGYAGFADFGLWRLEIDTAHLVAGFGRIADPSPSAILVDLRDAEALLEGETGAVDHMNADHADAIALYATRLAGASPGDWRLAGCDPCGMTLVEGRRAVRVEFPRRVTGAGELRAVLVELAAEARKRTA